MSSAKDIKTIPLTKAKGLGNMCYCRGELTFALDNLIPSQYITRLFYNYILYDNEKPGDDGLRWFGIRIPGKTVGGVAVNDDNIIVKCEIAERCIGQGKEYPDNVNEVLKEFVGMKLVFPDVEE